MSICFVVVEKGSKAVGEDEVIKDLHRPNCTGVVFVWRRYRLGLQVLSPSMLDELLDGDVEVPEKKKGQLQQSHYKAKLPEER